MTLTLTYIEKIKGEYPKSYTKYGFLMTAIGTGKYPYDCTLKEKYPNAMIYKNEKGGWDALQRED